jgi:phosphohistidine phosphatase SixA
MPRFLATLWLVIACHATATNTATTHADPLAQAVNAIGANVVFMRHATAPGFGDPERFDITDCSTQRNLDDSGRRQAQQIGMALAQSSVRFTQVLSSEWCRCQETAALLGLGEWQTFSGLNSFFQGHADQNTTSAALAQQFASLPPGVTLMVSHQVVISLATGLSVESGGMIALNTQTKQAKRVQLH